MAFRRFFKDVSQKDWLNYNSDMHIKISIAQFQIQVGDYNQNFLKAGELIRKATDQKSGIVLLPELWLGGYDYPHFSAYLQESDETQTKIESLAKSDDIAIAGTFPVHSGDRFYNSLIYFDPSGSVSHYEKIHLFSLLQEQRYFSQGTESAMVNTPAGLAGLAICYDLRFPELFRKYALLGAKLILVSAEWPLARIDHWKTLLRARAIENQVFVIGCNSVGKSGKLDMGGASAIIDPWGRTLAEASTDSEELITADLDLDEIQKARESIPVFNDRRPEIYG